MADPTVDREPVVIRLNQWRRSSAAGALLAGAMIGLEQALGTVEKPKITLEVDAAGEPEEPEALDLQLDMEDPARSRAHVRPWLLPG